MRYTFTEAELEVAADEWGCNCGPSALAFALQMPLTAARYAIPNFEAKRYTSPSMMREALQFLKREHSTERAPKYVKGTPVDVASMFSDLMPSLVRVQWCGPWTEPGMNPRWAYCHTHWISTWTERGVPLVFDCNGGIQSCPSWIDEIVPLLTSYPRANGEWFPTHIWRIFAEQGVRP